MSLTYILYRLVQQESPSSGDTLLIDRNGCETRLLMTPSSTLATLTLDFPDDNHSILGQNLDIWSSHEITGLTCTGNYVVGGVSTPIIIDNAPNTILANSMISFTKVGSLHWTGTSQ